MTGKVVFVFMWLLNFCNRQGNNDILNSSLKCHKIVKAKEEIWARNSRPNLIMKFPSACERVAHFDGKFKEPSGW